MTPDVDERQANSALRAAASGGAQKRSFVRAMFSDIAPRYDMLNHLLSLNVDRRWRRRAIAALSWEARPEGVYLDVCAGTLDVAATLASRPGFRGQVIAADFAEPMVRAGVSKVTGLPVVPLVADALTIPLADASCDGAIVAFGARNLADLDAGLREVARVLRPGGRFVILEFTTPRLPFVRQAYSFYFQVLLPRIGGLVSGNRDAYRYLPASVANFPDERLLSQRMQQAGFRDVRWDSLTLGIAAVHNGTR